MNQIDTLRSRRAAKWAFVVEAEQDVCSTLNENISIALIGPGWVRARQRISLRSLMAATDPAS